MSQPKRWIRVGIPCVSACVVVPIVAMLLLAWIMAAYSPAPAAPPGPATTSLYAQMKPHEMQPANLFTQRFGLPDKTTETSVRGVAYFLCTYRCSDGYVLVAMNQPLGIVESVDEYGLERKRP